MLKEAIVTAKTIEAAIEEGVLILGVSRDDVEVEILEQPKKFFFRITPAKVRVFIERTKADIAKEILRDLLLRIGIDWEVKLIVDEQETFATIKMDGDKLGFIIGYRGETLDALQYLVGLMTNQIDDEYYRITLDCGNYRDKREKTLEKLAERLSKKVAKSGYSSKLEPMNPYERRIIHSIVQGQKDVTSESTGEEPFRAVVIKSTNPEAARKNNMNKRRPNNYNKNSQGFQSRGNQNANKSSSSNSNYKGNQNKTSPNYKGTKGTSNTQNRTNSNYKGNPNRTNSNYKGQPNKNSPVKRTQDIKPSQTKPTTTSEKVIGDLYGKIEL